jgi:hypothetical protein
VAGENQQAPMLTILCRVGEGRLLARLPQKKHGGEKERQQHKVIARDGESQHASENGEEGGFVWCGFHSCWPFSVRP